MASRIPFTGRPQEAMSITIEGRRLKLRARFGNLLGIWTLDVFDASDAGLTPLLMGIPIVMGADLVKPYRLGIGSLYAEPNARPRDDAGRGELGNRVELIHYAPGELDEAA